MVIRSSEITRDLHFSEHFNSGGLNGKNNTNMVLEVGANEIV